MAKKQNKKPRTIKKIDQKDNSSTVSKIEEEDIKTFDFGGIPDRDLKKNIGCGS